MVWCYGLDGDMIWSKELGDKGNTFMHGVNYEDGVIRAVGGAREFTDSLHRMDEHHVRLDSAGNLLYQSTITNNGYRMMEGIENISVPKRFMVGFTRDDEFTYEGGDDLFFLKGDDYLFLEFIISFGG